MSGEPGSYVRAEPVLRKIKKTLARGIITTQEARTLRGQALRGDTEAAERGLAKLVLERDV